jgi:putative hydrolase of the HAD superfamily
MIEVVAFDADDTLWDNERLYLEAQDRLQELLAPYDPDRQALRLLEALESENVSHYGFGIKSFTLSMIEVAAQVCARRTNVSVIQEVLQIGKSMLSAPVQLMEGAESVLMSLSDRYRLMLITMGDASEQEAKIQRSGVARYFSYIEIVGEKSSRRYMEILRKYAIRPRGFLMVGNSIRSDILPVIEIGGQAVQIPYARTWARENVPEEQWRGISFERLQSLGELPTCIERLSA